jgi:hypothetical protein
VSDSRTLAAACGARSASAGLEAGMEAEMGAGMEAEMGAGMEAEMGGDGGGDGRG